MKKYNASQREAILHCIGPALVLAGPGSGKTAVLTKRLQYLITVHQIRPEEILVVTFTKAAAIEMQQRFQNLMEAKLPVSFGTFHSIFYRILRESIPGKTLTLLNEKEKYQFLKPILKKYNLDMEILPACLEEISRYKNIIGVEKDSAEVKIPFFQEIMQEYRSICKEKRKIDFDDMAYEVLQLFQSRADLLEKWQRRFHYILIDEYQDIAPIQEKILSMLAAPGNHLFVVGDDDQSIYGFRGAGTSLMLEFSKRYPGTKEIRLEMNYRCRPEIISAAGKIIAENKMRFHKKQIPARESINTEKGVGGLFETVKCQGFITLEDEYSEIIKIIKGHINSLSKVAVLFRKNADAERLGGLLRKEKIPYTAAGKKKSLSEHFILRDILAYLKLIYGNNTRGNFLPIMNRPERGMKREMCSDTLLDFQKMKTWCRFDEEVLRNIEKLEKDIMRASKMNLYAAVMYIRKGFGYENYLKSEYKEEQLEEQLFILNKLQKMTTGLSTPEDLERCVQRSEEEKKGETEHKKTETGVCLLTYHGSKGLEFDCVILPDLNEGCVPHKKAVTQKDMEEERRMLYVAMTRAKEQLYLFYKMGTKEEPEEKSRFLKALEKE